MTFDPSRPHRRIPARVFLAIATLSLATLQAQVTLQFPPTEVHETPEEGPPGTYLRFADPPGHVIYTPPAGWRADAGQGSSLVLHPTAQGSARLHIAAVDARSLPPLKPDGPQPAETLRLYGELALLTLPDRATDPELLAPNPSVIVVEGIHAPEVRIRYQIDGLRWLYSRVHLPHHNNQQVVFTLSAPEHAFEALHRAMRASLFTWQAVDASQTAKPEAPENRPPP